MRHGDRAESERRAGDRLVRRANKLAAVGAFAGLAAVVGVVETSQGASTASADLGQAVAVKATTTKKKTAAERRAAAIAAKRKAATKAKAAAAAKAKAAAASSSSSAVATSGGS